MVGTDNKLINARKKENTNEKSDEILLNILGISNIMKVGQNNFKFIFIFLLYIQNMDSLNILEEPIYDSSIESSPYISYSPQSQHNLNDVITIDIHGSDAYLLPSESHIVIKGQLVNSTNYAAFTVNDKITLVNNAIMFYLKRLGIPSMNRQLKILIIRVKSHQ